jgi:NADP-dependent 3-hydroxy acid dehydrogenase YdfG
MTTSVKSVFISRGTAVIGGASALEFAEAGMDIILAEVDEQGMEQLADKACPS